MTNPYLSKMESKFQNFKLLFIGLAIAVICVALDLYSKELVFAYLDGQRTSYIEVFGFFNLVTVWNTGISFGMFNGLENSQVIFASLQSSIALILLVWLYRNQKVHVAYALGLIIGGALGNIIDRILNGAVADFLDFHIAGYHWPAFNLADSFIFIGVAILIFDEFFIKKKDA